MENSRGSSLVTAADLKNFEQAWQKFDLFHTGSISHRHLRPFMELVGEPFGRQDMSDTWYKVLQAEISIMPGSVNGEVSFRSLFIILTTKMIGADALCQGEDGEFHTLDEQVSKPLRHHQPLRHHRSIRHHSDTIDHAATIAHSDIVTHFNTTTQTPSPTISCNLNCI